MKLTDFRRFYALGGIFLLVFLLYTGILFNLQIRHHEDYLLQSSNSITQRETVEASRGIITDRTGRVLISNRSTYSLSLDLENLKSDAAKNDAIYRLVKLCQEQGVVWEDHLPFTYGFYPTYCVDTLSTTQKTRFLSYLKSLKPAQKALSEYLSSHPEVLETEDASPDEVSKDPLSYFPAENLTDALLRSTGILEPTMLDWMRTAMKVDESLSKEEARLILGVRYEVALRSLGTNTAYIMVEDLDPVFLSMLADGNFKGAKVVSSSVREYQTDYAAHVLGSVSRLYKEDYAELKDLGYDMDDWIGREGVEKAFESYLKGTDGVRVTSSNTQGKITGEYYSKEPVPGNTVSITLDLPFQQVVEDTLAETVTAMNAADGQESRGAGAAVIKVGTGEVLALASYPTYPLSEYRSQYTELMQDESKPLFNRATNGTYAPGSTLKPLTAAAALQEGVTTIKEKVRDTGFWRYPSNSTQRYGAHCWNRSGHGLVDASDAITKSCNYYFAEMGYRLGLNKLNEYLSMFGLGYHTGIEIGDSAGLLPSQNPGEDQAPWAAFGQANQLYSPLQLANYIATLVSGGKHCSAHLLKEVKTSDGSHIVATGNTEALNEIPLSDENLNAIKEGMHNLTTTSLAGYFKNCIVSAGAKTGTAQVGANQTNNGVFVCFAPYENPEIAVGIVIEQGDHGSALASTAVKILNAYFSEEEIGTAILPENTLIP